MTDTLTIILPIHNEVKTLESVVKSWSSSLKNIKNLTFEFSLCEDGSGDGTKDLIQKLVREKTYPIVDSSVNFRRGYGQAVRDGISQANSNWVLCIDSDGQCCPSDFEKFWANRFNHDFVMGHRFTRNDPFIRLVYSKLFFYYHRLLFSNKLNDPSCPYVLGKKDKFLSILKYLTYMREGFWWGFVGACVKNKLKIHELKIDHKKRMNGDTQVYKSSKMPSIIFRNLLGLLKLRLSR